MDDYAIKRFNEEYTKSLKWYKSHPEEAGKMVVETIPMLDADGISDSIKYVQLNTVKAKDAKKDLEFFYKLLEKNNPNTIGGKLPDDGFYY